jgi:hypothetical protein
MALESLLGLELLLCSGYALFVLLFDVAWDVLPLVSVKI